MSAGLTVAVLGAGGFAREVAMILDQLQCKVFYLSDNPQDLNRVLTYGTCIGNILSAKELFEKHNIKTFIPGIGSPKVRETLVSRMPENMKSLILISPYAHVGSGNKIGNGTIICAHTSITCDTKIGNFVNVNLNCTIGHDAEIGDYSNLSPGVHISGYARVGKYVDIGTGAVILPKVVIGDGAVIGAGAVVNRNVVAGTTVVGVPAKEIIRKE